LTAQTQEFTEELRKTEKHPALSSRPKERPVEMWVFTGKEPGFEPGNAPAVEIRICPPGSEEVLAFTRWTRPAAMIYRGHREHGAWSAPPEFIGYITTSEAKFMATVLESMEGPADPTNPAPGPSVTEVPSA
jgi:hypothetical protein